MSTQTRRSRQQHEIEELLAALPEAAAFVSTTGQAFATLPGGQTFPLSSAYLRDWLIDQYLKRHSQQPAETSLREAIRSLRAQSHSRPRPRPVDVRIVATNQTIYIDLANAQSDAVQITPGHWQITSPAEVAFQSTRGQLALPRPEGSPTTNDERTTTNGFFTPAVQQWLQTALQPTGPYPILVLHGPPGSGKSTMARMLRALIDPVRAPIQPLPSRGREVLDLATRDRVLVFDHVTRMSNSTADALCQISAGIAVAVKETGDRTREPLRLDIARPIILTTPRCGLSDWQPRPDLAARMTAVELPKIENFRHPQDLWNEFESNRPRILSELYTAVAQRLANPNDERTTTNDERGVGLYTASSLADPVFQVIKAFAAKNPNWTGTATDLPISTLTPRALSHRLRQLQPTLALHGIQIEFHRKHNGRREIIIRAAPNENLRHPVEAVPLPVSELPTQKTPQLAHVEPPSDCDSPI